MVEFHSKDKKTRDMYKYLIGCVVPRPIAWVSTRSAAGEANLAPFSFFNGVGANPPALAFSPNDRADGMKDTCRNILEHPEFIVHVVSEPISAQMNVTCGDYGADIDEFVEAGLTAVPGTAVDVPRVKEALVAFECKLYQHIRMGEHPPHNNHIIGEIVYWHIDDSILDESARNPVRPELLQAVGRMGGIEYARTTDRFEIVRPVIEAGDPRSIPARKSAQEAAAAPKIPASGG
ncbi:MAG: flavin reductase family protein [SAR324 cluster bacterium]|nr:flavin reductase family protein [SAR324 cluster bacterium]